MNRLITKILIFFIAITMWQAGGFLPVTPYFTDTLTIAEAHHKPKHTGGGKDKCAKNPKKCEPPTVSELPIQYMVMSGALMITLFGGTTFYLRKQKVNPLKG